MDSNQLNDLESRGPATVLREMARGLHGQPGSPLRSEVDAWILSKMYERDNEAIRSARRANRIAWIAIGITTAIGIMSIIKDIIITFVIR
jgi:hypothetical protein